MLSKKLAALAALSMLTVSTASVAQSAAAPTVASSSVRASAVVEDASELEGRKTWLWIALAAAIVLAIILISDGGDSRSP